MPFRRKIAVSLFCNDMNNNAFIDLPGLGEHLLHGLDVVTVHRSEIGQSHILKKHPRDNQLLKTALVTLQGFDYVLPDLWQL